MKVKGIIQGKTIKLSEAVTAPDGTEVIVEILDRPLVDKSQWQQLQQVAGAWQNDSEIDKVFAEIDRERHAYRGRDSDFNAFE